VTYATHADIDARYPGELAQAGPTVAGVLNEAAITLALKSADALIDRALSQGGWSVPVSGVIPYWIVDLAVDLALYLATPTVIASQSDFTDRHLRYLAAQSALAQLAKGTFPVITEGTLAVYGGGTVGAQTRLFGPGSL